MDKAIIFNVFDFVNFYICKYLLDNGVEIKGVLLEDKEKILFLEEKRLEVGRNANFTEVSFKEWAEDCGNRTFGTIIFSLYDLFMLFKENILEEKDFCTSIFEFLENRKESKEAVVLILPVQILEAKKDAPEFHVLSGFLEKIMERCQNRQFIYLPTVYGPWQPEVFLFQQSILAKLQADKEHTSSREEMGDALFIEDAAVSIVKIMEEKGSGKFLLESGVEDQWKLCAAFLDIKTSGEESNEKLILEDIMRIPQKKMTDVSEALSLQVAHTRRLYHLF